MPRCVCCKRKNHLTMTCKWCDVVFCPRCIPCEEHFCKNMSTMKHIYNRQNEELLVKHKVEEVKVIKI